MSIGEYLTCEEAADHLGVSTSRVRQLVLEGRLASKKVGGQHFFVRSVVTAFGKIERQIGRPPALAKK